MSNKREQLEHLLGHSNIDCLGLTETWLKQSSPEALVNMPGYNAFRKDRVKGKGGGALLYVKDTIQCKQIEWPAEVQIECVGLDITLSTEMSFILICLYRHPNAKADFYDQLKVLLNFCDLNKEIILIGDFNVNWDDKKGRKNLKQITDQYNFTQLVEQPTRITNNSKTRIDLLFSNKAERIIKNHNLLTGLSDHNIIFFSRKLTKQRFYKSSRPQSHVHTIPKNQQQNFIAAIRGRYCSCHYHNDTGVSLSSFVPEKNC